MEGLLRITLFVACALYTEAQIGYHEYGLIETCGDGPDQDNFLVTFDNELVAYVDFKKKKDVLTIPDSFAHVQYPGLYEDAVKAVSICREISDMLKEVYVNSSEQLDAPWTSIYTKNDAELNVKNTLICHVTGFFPPPVTVSWTRNNLNVTDNTTLSRYYPNSDGTLNVFSRLNFVPVMGDVYSCTVDHKALQEPQTRIWEAEIREPSIGPLVFCGVGLGFGMLGLAAGVFIMVKCNSCS